ncbi:serine/threonine-protein kinase [Actinocrispum sp. NPDC049592]|uniref:serine/threonine-protein kinase n=1 Tax=Actinocrispum sp. NPDC049592 TaxID=3154835 RepID=UPI003430457A
MRVVAGRYAIRDELGRGGMGVVWRADDQVIGRQVALKEISTPHGLSTSESNIYLERVLREARTAGRLNDPAVVTVYDVVSEGGVTFIVMELVEAPTLADLIAEQGALSADRVAALGVQVLGALETAHAAGIVHRDVKPSNIMVLPGDRVKLADFGIARAMDDPNLTMTGGIMGSPGYMSPELFTGSPPSPAADLWALGATLFHAVEGYSPFNRETTAATMHAILYDEPGLSRCTGPLADVIMGLLTQPAENRLTATQAREQLKAIQTGDSTQVVEPPTVRVQAVRRNTLPREPWQDGFAEEQPPPAAPAPVHWAGSDEWEPKRKPANKRVLLLAGASGLVVAALVTVFLVTPTSSSGEAGPAPGTSTVVAVAETPTSTASSVSASVSAPPTTSSTVPAPGTVTVTKSASQAPPPGQPVPPGQTPPPSSPAPPPRTLVTLTRFVNPKGPHMSATAGVPAPAGYNKEFPIGSLVAASEAGTRKLYACQVNTSDDHFTSADAKCEGHKVLGTLGFAFTAAPAGVGSHPIYRCTYSGGHFDSIHADCEGYNKEFVLGYLL